MTAGRRPYRPLVAVLILLGVVAVTASAQQTGRMPRQLEGTGLDPRLGDQVPQDVVFQNEQGADVALERYFDGERPVLLVPVYHECPMLCNIVLHALTETLGRMTWTPGEQFDILTVSFNPRETPAISAEKKDMYVSMLGRPEAAAGWHFLTGDEAAIAALTDAVGFRYRWVEEEQAYAHPSTLIFLGGGGTIARYLRGVEYDPRDVRTALVEASSGKIGSTADQFFLYCFQYDPKANSYVPHALNLMKLGGGLTVLVLGLMLFIYWRRESRRSWRDAAA